jgi:hypothetical protein
MHRGGDRDQQRKKGRLHERAWVGARITRYHTDEEFLAALDERSSSPTFAGERSGQAEIPNNKGDSRSGASRARTGDLLGAIQRREGVVGVEGRWIDREC